MPDFWRHSGFHLLERRADGHLIVTDDLLRAYLLRPEIRPIDESGPHERALHARLMDDPCRRVDATELATIEDADARENYGVVLGFRDALVAAGTLEACYARLHRAGNIRVPPIFLDQIAHMVVRSLLDGTDDGLLPRAGELFFREQRITVTDGAIMAADAETVDLHASGSAYGDLGRLIAEAQTPMRRVDLEVLDRDNADRYFDRDERHDLVISLNHGRASVAALATVMERWIAHFLAVPVRIRPVGQIHDERWVWHIGLDAEATTILNALWRGEAVDHEALERLLCLFCLEFQEPGMARTDVGGRPVYLALAMNRSNVVRMKPQNLLLNLPLAGDR